MTMHFQPFAFERVFAAPAPTEAIPEREKLLAEIDRLGSELELVRRQAFADGEAEALRRFREERDTALLSATDALHSSLEAIEDRFEEVEADVVRDATALALAAAEQIAGHALESDPVRGVDEAIGRALGELRRGAPIEVRVHPELVERVEAAVDARQSRDRRTIALTVIGDGSVDPGDARLSWERSGMHIAAAERRRRLAEEIGQLLRS